MKEAAPMLLINANETTVSALEDATDPLTEDYSSSATHEDSVADGATGRS